MMNEHARRHVGVLLTLSLLGACAVDDDTPTEIFVGPDAGSAEALDELRELEVDDADHIDTAEFDFGTIDVAQSNVLGDGGGFFDINDSTPWPGGVIPYYVSMADCPGGDEAAFRAKVEKGVAEWNARSRLVFIPYEPGSNASRIKFLCNHDTNIVYYPGYPGANDTRTVHITETARTSTVVHEIGHAVGLLHEHTRSDRGGFVRVLYESVVEKAYDFYKCDTTFGCTSYGPYDHDSIMHYSSTAHGDGFATLLDRTTWSLSTSNDASYKSCRPDTGGALDEIENIRVADFDGDGGDDLLRYDAARQRFQVSFVDPAGPILCADFVDLHPYQVSIGSMDEVLIGDFDDDATADILVADGNTWRFYESQRNWVPQPGYSMGLHASELMPGMFADDDRESGLLHVDVRGEMRIYRRTPTGIEATQTEDNYTIPCPDSLQEAADSWLSLGPSYPCDLDYYRPVVGNVRGAGDVDDILLWDPSTETVKIIDGGFGDRESYYVPYGEAPNWRLARTLSDGGVYERLSWWADGELHQVRLDGSAEDTLPGTPTVTADPAYFWSADFNGNGFEHDILLHGWIPRPLELSDGDISNIEAFYGPCTTSVKQEFTNCYHPLPLVETVVSLW